MVRAHGHRGGPVLPVEQDVLGVRRDRREYAAQRQGTGVRLVRYRDTLLTAAGII
jgi:hypothetical protein